MSTRVFLPWLLVYNKIFWVYIDLTNVFKGFSTSWSGSVAFNDVVSLFHLHLQYLQMLEYTKSAGAFDKETNGKGKQILVDALPPSQDENQMHIQVCSISFLPWNQLLQLTSLQTFAIDQSTKHDSSEQIVCVQKYE